MAYAISAGIDQPVRTLCGLSMGLVWILGKSITACMPFDKISTGTCVFDCENFKLDKISLQTDMII